MKRLLVTGAGGLIGSHLLRQAATRFDAAGTFHDRQPRDLPGHWLALDITDAPAVENVLAGFRPDVIIHCAAVADSDACQTDPLRARRSNVEATRTLARCARQLGAKFVFLSTDLVFDGLKKAPYVEDDPPSPIGVYAQSKADAERAVRAECAASVIVRTSLVYGFSPRGDRSVNERLALALKQRRPINLFVDEFRCPISAVDLADAALELADSPHTGIFHIAGPEKWSRYDLGMAIARRFGWPTQPIKAARVAEVAMNPPRPADLVLDSGKAQRVLLTKLRGLAEGLAAL